MTRKKYLGIVSVTLFILGAFLYHLRDVGAKENTCGATSFARAEISDLLKDFGLMRSYVEANRELTEWQLEHHLELTPEQLETLKKLKKANQEKIDALRVRLDKKMNALYAKQGGSAIVECFVGEASGRGN